MADKHVVNSAICRCTLGTVPATLQVNSQTRKKIEGKLQATEEDKTFTLFGSCTKSSPPPPCSVSPATLGAWNNTAQSTRIDGKRVLLNKSTIGCMLGGTISIQNENQTTTETSDRPTNKIKKVFHGELHFRRLLGEIAGSTFNYGNKGDYAIFPNGFTNILKTQCYGFDWIRDVLDGDEDYLQEKLLNYNTIGGKQNCQIYIKFATGKYYYGKLIHKVEYISFSQRKVSCEYFYFITLRMYDETITPPQIVSFNKIFEYDHGRNLKSEHIPGDPIYNNITTNIGGYPSAKSTQILSSFVRLTRNFTPINQYIETPKGTFMAGSNQSNAIYEINDKNYYVPWITLMPGKTVKIQALTFVDAAPPPGEIRFVSSSPELTITPSKISVPNILSYPTTSQNSPIPNSNIEILDITATNTNFDKNQIIEARFFDNSRASEPDYLGEVIGLLNVLQNKPTYKVNCYFVRVSFTDRSNRTGLGFPLNPTIPLDATRSKNAQLTKVDTLKNLFNSGSLQDEYLKLMFKQALIEYNTPSTSTYPVSDMDVDFDDFLPTGSVSGISASDLGNIIYSYSGDLLDHMAKKRSLNDGITFFILPYELAGLFGQSHGIGGQAKSVMITQLMLSQISSDRATAIHEGAHSLGLYHSFMDDGGDINQFLCVENERKTVFLDDKTENVMDYTAAARTFYKWQWEKMQSDYPDVSPNP